jgi:anaerobic magnesium-protoporphyrin IX monomethyl ester cyclase
MKVALVNPRWTFEGSIYFGCREPHLPLEYGYAQALLERAGHQVTLVDAHADGLDPAKVCARLEAARPDWTVVTTAPSYLFWRCAPPELRVPMRLLEAIREVAGEIVVVGPHASTTPGPTLRKLGAGAAVMGECEEVLLRLAETPRERWSDVDSLVLVEGRELRARGGKAASDLTQLPALHWPDATVQRHAHHHHRFERPPVGPGAEVEASRGCPYACTFCAKNDFRSGFRRRPLTVILEEIDALVAQGVEYLYFIDEIFLPHRELLDALSRRPVTFGVQMRIDNWDREGLDCLGRAGCVSIEAGVESITPEGRSLLAKRCRLSTEELTALLEHAKRRVPFVQANLIAGETDRLEDVARWRERLKQSGVWANVPVPMFSYPGSPEYVRRWGPPDDQAWERAHEDYLSRFSAWSDLQANEPLPLPQLEALDAS